MGKSANRRGNGRRSLNLPRKTFRTFSDSGDYQGPNVGNHYLLLLGLFTLVIYLFSPQIDHFNSLSPAHNERGCSCPANREVESAIGRNRPFLLSSSTPSSSPTEQTVLKLAVSGAVGGIMGIAMRIVIHVKDTELARSRAGRKQEVECSWPSDNRERGRGGSVVYEPWPRVGKIAALGFAVACGWTVAGAWILCVLNRRELPRSY